MKVSGLIKDQGNGVKRKLVGCLLLSWIVVCAYVIKGVKSSGKVFERLCLFSIEYIKSLLSVKETELHCISCISPYFDLLFHLI